MSLQKLDEYTEKIRKIIKDPLLFSFKAGEQTIIDTDLMMSKIPPPKIIGWRYMDEDYHFDNNWIKVRNLEWKINKLINQIFQERPSLP